MNTSATTKVLIVEDEPRMGAALREFLQAAYPAITILEASDGASALDLCRGHAIALVITDVGLPDINGIDLTSQVRKMLPDTTVIVVSQQNAGVYAEKARQSGAIAFVSKDRIREELLPLVADVIGPDCWRRSQ